MLYGECETCARELLSSALRLSKNKTLRSIDMLDCSVDYKEELKLLVERVDEND